MKAKDLRERSTDDLRQLAAQLGTDLFHYRMKNFTHRLDDTSMVTKTRREIARIHTILAERNRAGGSETR